MPKKLQSGAKRVRLARRRDYLAQKISKRWAELEPFRRAAEIRGRPTLGASAHQEIVTRLLGSGLEMRDIRRTGADLPTLSANEREELLRAYVRRKSKQARGKGAASPASRGSQADVSGLSLLRD